MIISFLVCIAQDTASWLRYPAISPDGNTILFNYKGDIYRVPAAGGQASPLTLSETYEVNAVWSHDGSQVAFASNRYGNFDVFVMPAAGGEARRLTYHSTNERPSDFTSDNKHIIFSGVRQDLHTNVQFPSGVMAELYSVPTSGGRVDLVLTSPAHDATYNSDGSRLIFHDRKGYENDWRKHHTSAVTRDIFTYNLSDSSYTELSTFAGEDRNPVFAGDDNTYYFLSEQNGSFNIYRSSLDNPEEQTAITTFSNHPVRFLSISDHDVLCFSWHGDLYTLIPGSEPRKVDVTMGFDGRQEIHEIESVNGGMREATLSPNGKEFAFIVRGEIFVSSIEHGTTKRVTNTPYQERSVNFSPDGRSLVYAAEVDSSWNIYTMSIHREDEPYFYVSTLLDRETILASAAEEFQPAYAPDGEEIAYLEDRTTLRIYNIESKASRTVMQASYNYSYSDGDQWYQWSPDSKWLLVSFGPESQIFRREAGIVNASGQDSVINLTQSGWADFGPKWAMDGKMMIWGSTREGRKTAGGNFNEGDIYGMFFTQEAFDLFNLSEEEFDLYKELKDKKEKEEKEDEDNEEAEDDNKKGKNKKDKDKEKEENDKEDEEEIEPLTFDWENVHKRKKRLTQHTSRIRDWLLGPEGEKLYYITRFEDKNDIWETELRTGKTKKFCEFDGRSMGMELSDDGEFLFVISDGKPYKVELKDGKKKGISVNGEMVLNRAAERAYIFNHSWRQVREKFYVEDLQGVDWDFYYDAYRPFLDDINNNYDFAEMLSEMLGELNASHTGSGYRFRKKNGDQTASLGVLYDYGHEGDGLRIAEVLYGGPLSKSGSKVAAGQIIERIDGVAVTDSIDFYQLLNRKQGDNVLLHLYDPATGNRWEETVKPISLGAENQLLYDRWVKTRREDVLRLSDGRLGYVHVRGMNDASMRTVHEDALGRHIDAEALIVDTRFNGGGNLHETLSDFLNGKKYMDIIPHGQYVGSEPMDKWCKPSIVIMSESNYSDAHLFPVIYKIKNIGETLGMPVPGTGTFVWWETQIDPTLYFGIPMGGWKPLDGPFLENNQLDPDIRVKNEPDRMAVGTDQQLEAAVEELLKG